MITQIRGRLVERNPTDVVVDCNGVGYLLHISLNTFTALPSDENVTLYSHLVVREDAHILYGFATKTEREVFKLLISVSGVGPSIARTMLSSMTADEIQHAIASGNLQIIQSVKGIGLKTAQRVILDIKDKVLKELIVEAGMKRLRPVLLTAITTVLGLIPLATGMNVDFFTLISENDPHIFFGGDNVIFWGPMSWTVIFGLSFATFLTLVIVPVMYYLLIRFKYKLAGFKG